MTKQMPAEWTGKAIGQMHNERITYEEVAKEMGVTKSYLSMIFNGKRQPPDAQKRIEAAIATVRQKRTQDTTKEERG